MMRVLVVLALLLGAQRAGAQPAAEVARVRAHLVAARQFVQARDLSALQPAQRVRREAALAILDRYITRGEFPARTDDAYPGMRPRFIDARGVHCAVGEMIAKTGHEDLAQRINARWQYSYVHDIDEPALLAWARDYGFTVGELARIQPSYSSPPTREGLRREIEEQKDSFMLACADAPPPTQVTVRVAVNVQDVDSPVPVEKGKRLVEISAPANADAFTKCFAAGAAANVRWPGGAFSPWPSSFSTDMTFTLRTPSDVLDKRLREQVGFGEQCAPRPGALAKTATISITNTPEDGFAIKVTTAPVNRAIETCISDYLEQHTNDFYGVSGLAYRHQATLVRMSAKRVQDAIDLRAPGFATDCYTDGAPTSVKITASAKPDDKAFTLTTDSTNEAFGRCLLDKLQPALRKQFTVGGYFRIDNQIETRTSIPIETPKARDERLAKAREDAIRKRRELEAEIRRHRYGF